MIKEEILKILFKTHLSKRSRPLSLEKIVKFESEHGYLPEDLKTLYLMTNGLIFGSFKILPIFEKNNPKTTWDSIDRANDPNFSKFRLSEDLLKKFLIFCELEGLNCAMYDKNDNSIWYEDDEGYHRTSLNLEGFITGLIEEEHPST